VLACAASAAGADWIRLRDGDIELLTDAGAGSGRETLARLAQIRAVLPAAPPGRSGARAARVYLFASGREFQNYAESRSTGGFYQSGLERDYIALPAGSQARRGIVHEYIHLLLDRGAPALPLWFEEGTAEFYSTAEIRGGRVRVGAPVEEHVRTLAGARWVPAAELMRASRTSRLYDERSRAGLFYAQSWALVHMLNLAPGYRDGMARLAESLAAGEEAEPAFLAAFGKTPAQAVRELERYLPGAGAVTVEGAAPASRIAPPEPLTALEAVLARAELALRTRHYGLALRLYEQAAREQGGSAEAQVGLGMLALHQGDRAAARGLLERAIAAGGVDASAWFEYALFERESGAPRERVTELLRQAVARNPALAEAQFTLGVRATDDGDYQAAVAHLRQAVAAQPRRSSFWHALAFALEKLGRRPEARDAAGRARRTAATPEEESMAEALAESLRVSP
jgi:tetratricopeptide (TPR) repeat protein